jgi:hypothetical protein
MFSNSNPHAQQLLQSGDDIFGRASMQVEDPADNYENPSTLTRPPPPSTMFLNPHAWQLLQSGDDVFEGAPMQVEDPADNNKNPFMSVRPTICISEQTIQKICKQVERAIRPNNNDDWIHQSLGHVFLALYDAL